MEINPETDLKVGQEQPNSGLCVSIDIWDDELTRPKMMKIHYRAFEIAKSFNGAIKESVDLGYYGGPRIYYFPHEFYNNHPTIIDELQTALKMAIEEREELIGIAKRDAKILALKTELASRYNIITKI